MMEITRKSVAKRSKKILDKVLLQKTQIDMENNLDSTNQELLTFCDVSQFEYEQTIENMQKKLYAIYKRKPEVNIGPYNTVILSLLRANMNF